MGEHCFNVWDTTSPRLGGIPLGEEASESTTARAKDDLCPQGSIGYSDKVRATLCNQCNRILECSGNETDEGAHCTGDSEVTSVNGAKLARSGVGISGVYAHVR